MTISRCTRRRSFSALRRSFGINRWSSAGGRRLWDKNRRFWKREAKLWRPKRKNTSRWGVHQHVLAVAMVTVAVLLSLGLLLTMFCVWKAVVEMSRQKAQQAARQLPPSGPDGELRFQPDARNLAQEHHQGENWGLTLNLTPSALDRGLNLLAL